VFDKKSEVQGALFSASSSCFAQRTLSGQQSRSRECGAALRAYHGASGGWGALLCSFGYRWMVMRQG
jgi:hypothetical protein